MTEDNMTEDNLTEDNHAFGISTHLTNVTNYMMIKYKQAQNKYLVKGVSAEGFYFILFYPEQSLA